MKAVIVFLTFLAVGYAARESFEGINIHDYKNSEARIDKFVDCITDDGPCDKLDAVFKARGRNIVKTNCEKCKKREKRITRDLVSLLANDDASNLRSVLEVFDPKSKYSKSFLLWARDIKSLAGIPKIPREIINEYHDFDGHEVDDYEYYGDYRPHSKFVKRGGIVGGVRRLLRAILEVVGI